MESKSNLYFWCPRLDFVIRKVKEYAPTKPTNTKILDVGCGYGRFSYFLASLGYDVCGIDISKEAVGFAESEKIHKNCSFKVVKDISKLKGTYDIIISTEVLEHVEDPCKFLRGLNKLMKEDALLILTTPNGYSLFQFLDRIINFYESTIFPKRISKNITHFLRKNFLLRRMYVKNKHKQYFTLKNLVSLLEKNGLKPIKSENASFLIGFAMLLLPFYVPKRIECDLDKKLVEMLPSFLAEDWWIIAKKSTITN